MGIIDWITQNWLSVIGIIIAIEKVLRLLNNLLPEKIQIDNDIADILAHIIKAIGPKHK
jgi:hypothetical protein